MLTEIIRNLSKNASKLSQDIYVSKELKNVSEDSYRAQGYTFNIKEKKDIIAELLKLPEYLECEGVQFRLQLFKNHGDMRLVYSIFHVEDSSKHKAQIDKYGCWDSPITGHTGSFLLLKEGINNEQYLLDAIEDFSIFIRENGL